MFAKEASQEENAGSKGDAPDMAVLDESRHRARNASVTMRHRSSDSPQ